VPVNDSSIPVLSFFTGGGFLDIGFERAGFKIVWTNENDPAVATMYAYGMTSWRRARTKRATEATITNTHDVSSVQAHMIKKQAFAEDVPRIFGVIGGPPCPDFSKAGRHEGSNGTNGKLTKTYVNRITALNPDFFVLENVAGLFRTKRHRAFLAELERRLEANSYCLDLKILNALELGVPQDRERLIMIGIQSHVMKRCVGRNVAQTERGWFPWPELPKYRNAKTRFDWPAMSTFGETPERPKDIPRELTVAEALRGLPEANSKDQFNAYSKRFSTVKEGDTKRKSFKRLHRYRFSPTACYGHREVHLHPWKKRRLSVREAMRVQGIPDEYALPAESTLGAKFAIVSNGVPVPLAFHVAKCLNKFLKPALRNHRAER